MRTAIVTGAGGGLGRAIVTELSGRGYVAKEAGSLDLWVNNAGILATGLS